MSKKNEASEQPTTQGNPVVELLQGDKAISDKAAVVVGYQFMSQQAPPAVYVQSDDRLTLATANGDDLAPLTEAVSQALIADGYAVRVSPVYGDVVTTGKVWQVIDYKLNP